MFRSYAPSLNVVLPVIVGVFNTALVSVLLVRVSDVAKPTSVSLDDGKVTVILLTAPAPIRVVLLLPLSEFSKNSTKPAEVFPFFTLSPALYTSKPLCITAPLNVGVPDKVPDKLAPLTVGVVSVLFVSVLLEAEKYVSKSVIATCFIVPSSLNTTLSALATVVEVALVSPSITLSSDVVEVTPSRIFISAAVEVTPSKILISDVDAVTPFKTFNCAAEAVTSVPPNLRPFVPSWEAISKSYAPSLNVELPVIVTP